MRGVNVRLVPRPEVVSVYPLGLSVGDIGYVTRVHYERRLVLVRFYYSEVWIRAQDVEIVSPHGVLYYTPKTWDQ